jgi:hypothetical protein
MVALSSQNLERKVAIDYVDLLVGRIKRNGKHGVRGVRDE